MTAITDRGSSPLRCPDKHKGGLRFRLGMEKFMRRLFSSDSDLQILDLEPQDRLDAPERLPEPRPTQNLQLTGPMQRPVVLASCKARHPNGSMKRNYDSLRSLRTLPLKRTSPEPILQN